MASLSWWNPAPATTAMTACSPTPTSCKTSNSLALPRPVFVSKQAKLMKQAKGLLVKTRQQSNKKNHSFTNSRSNTSIQCLSQEQKWTHEGSITESLPNGMFRVKLDNADVVLGYISGKIRKNFIRLLPGDRVKIEVSRYDSTKGRIIYRLRGGREG
ncbi:translation initiation factor IF-1, chloroplastic [Nicotiana tabacum]|uniref:Translation initiation factor IF-1, chloroplastic n=1 Tax=Nicotiana tabacum TaxID=4097 RepID=A0A1S4DFY2_TOBAC|nr:PREDICTED: translation initiation factor IF-1, chloroplastic-like [Nicotiana tabacum]